MTRPIAEQLEDLQLDGALILDETRAFVRTFCVFPDEHCLNAVALWAAHAHLVGHLHTTPRLALLSPEPASGKTRVLEVLELLVPEARLSLNASPAAIFRLLAEKQICVLFDEVDAIWREAGKDDRNEDLRALLNAGYRRGATIPRCVGPKHDVANFAVFCAAALAGLGALPDTLMSRSIIIRMRRRAPGEDVEPFRHRQCAPEGHRIRDRLAAWAKVVGTAIADSEPEMPSGIVDRPAEVWEPLLAVADAAGGEWPDRARYACVRLCAVAADRRVSLGVRLLSDLRIIFRDAIALHTEVILERLIHGEEHGLDADAPWDQLRGQPLGKRGLATLLKQYDVHPVKVKVDGRALQGYRREHLFDAWMRYLPSAPGTAEPAEPALDLQESGRFSVPEVPQVPVPSTAEGAWWDT